MSRPCSHSRSGDRRGCQAGARVTLGQLTWLLAWLLPWLAITQLALGLALPGQARGIAATTLAPAGATPRGIAECGTLHLPAVWRQGAPPGNEALEGTPLGGLSALGWEPDTETLYLASDEGWLHRARLSFEDDWLVDFTLLASHPLRDAAGLALRGDAADAESLLVEAGSTGDTTLLIGFEREHRLQRFRPDGHPIGDPLRPPGLVEADHNAGAEALAAHRHEGLIVGLEGPVRGLAEGNTRLFAPESGRQWRYPLAPEAGSALTALEAHGDHLLALERAFAPPAPLVISLRRVRLTDSNTATVETLSRLSSGEGWRLDNFEGLTRLDDERFLMVSDDNFIRLQSTLLSCFRLRDG
ncbi:esterase-like activity of phytase family protein [Onishia taeanensis]